MSKNRKYEVVDNILTEAVVVEAQPEKPKIPFEHWFGKLVKSGKIRWYDDDALWIFFRNQGLTKNEDEDTYNRAFEKF